MRKFENIGMPDNIRIQALDGGKEFELLEDYRVFWSEGGLDFHYTAPKGFVTDFASIPRIFTSLIPKLGRHNGPSIIHDHMYVEKTWKKRDVDNLFRATLKHKGVPYHRRILMWLAVRSPVGRLVWET